MFAGAGPGGMIWTGRARRTLKNSRREWTAALGGRQPLGYSFVRETSMTLIWLGVLLVFAGLLQMTFQPIWRGRLSGGRQLRAGRRSDTLEPERPASGFGIKANWPGLALVALGAVMLLAGAFI
jgi:hypothetical protein